MLFVIGDLLAGALTGAVIAFAIHFIVTPGMDMVIAMLIGMGLGMLLHLPIGLLLSPFLGMFETMMPGSLIGMYGGMLFAMRDSMGAGSTELGSALLVGAVFGLLVTVAMKLYGRVLRGPVVEAER